MNREKFPEKVPVSEYYEGNLQIDLTLYHFQAGI